MTLSPGTADAPAVRSSANANRQTKRIDQFVWGLNNCTCPTKEKTARNACHPFSTVGTMPGVVLISLNTCLEIENDRKFEKYTNQTRKYLHALSRSLTRARGNQNYVAAVEFGVEVGIEKW